MYAREEDQVKMVSQTLTCETLSGQKTRANFSVTRRQLPQRECALRTINSEHTREGTLLLIFSGLEG